MFKDYYDSFDCEITPEELRDYELWSGDIDELNKEKIIYNSSLENLSINEEDIPF